VLHATLIDYQITKGRKIVISDTNLVKKYRNELDDKLTEAGYKVYYVVCNTPFIVCQARNAAREKPVPFFAMTRMQEAMEAL
jgi:predicted kinase